MGESVKKLLCIIVYGILLFRLIYRILWIAFICGIFPNRDRPYCCEVFFCIPETEFYGILIDTTDCRYKHLLLAKDSTTLCTNIEDNSVSHLVIAKRGESDIPIEIMISNDTIIINSKLNRVISPGDVEWINEIQLKGMEYVEHQRYIRQSYHTLSLLPYDNRVWITHPKEYNQNWEIIDGRYSSTSYSEHRQQRKERLRSILRL